MTIHCRICGQRMTSPSEINDPRWNLFKGVPVKVCPSCYALHSIGDEVELEKRNAHKSKELFT